MPMIDRRRLLGGSTLALAATLLPRTAFAATITVPKAPVARLEPVKDSYFGETLTDPYRWMEKSSDPDWLPYLKAQNDRTRAVLDALPDRAALLRRIEQLSGDTVSTGKVQRAGGRLFYQQRPLGADNFKLFVRDATGIRTLVDPVALSAGSTGHISLDWWEASPDGQLVAYGLSKDGSEDSTLHVLTVADGRDLPDRIGNTQSAHPQWLEDNSGFFYTQLTGKVDTPERFLDAQARFHRLGTDPADDPILMKRGLVADVAFDKIQTPFIQVYPGSRFALLGLADVRPEYRLLIAPLADVLANKARWRAVASFEDEVSGVEIVGDDLYLLSNKEHPRGRLLRTSAAKPDLATAIEVVPQGPLVIEDLARARDGLYLRIMDGGISRLRKLGRDGRIVDIALPFDGTIGGLFATETEDGPLISLSGWLTPTGVWSVDVGGRVADTGLTPKPAIDVSAYETRRFFASAKDGVKIPYTLIYRKGLKLDGSHPTWISAYGSYGAAA